METHRKVRASSLTVLALSVSLLALPVAVATPPGQPYTPREENFATTVRAGEAHRYCSYAYDSDPGTDLLRLTFKWGDGTNTLDQPRNEGTWTCLSHTYAHGGSFTIVVAAKDANGEVGPDSQGFTVTVIGHYALEAKAWIPQWRAVDPALMTGPDWATYTPGITDSGRKCYGWPTPPQQFNGWFAGDNHPEYEGSHRAIVAAEFDVTGTTISNFVTDGNYGETLRMRAYRWVIAGVEIRTETCVLERRTVTHDMWAYATGPNAFAIGYETPNPFYDGSPYPTVSSNIHGRFESDGSITLDTTVDQFPSHGFKIYRDGELAFTFHQDVSCLADDQVMGTNGFWNLERGLNWGRSETLTVPRTASGGITYGLSGLC